MKSERRMACLCDYVDCRIGCGRNRTIFHTEHSLPVVSAYTFVCKRHRFSKGQEEGEGKVTELKPCPFCGKEVKIKVTHDDHYVIECDNCNSSTSFPYLHSREDIINAWNTRPNPWHTGIPKEEGWYLIKYRGIYGHAIGRTEYRAVHRYTLDGLPMIDGGINADDIWKPIEWQKIEEN